MNAWSQEEQQEEELHESSANRLYECKPVKMYLAKIGICCLYKFFVLVIIILGGNSSMNTY